MANTPLTNAGVDPYDRSVSRNVVDSADLETKSPNILQQLFERMSPRHCLGSVHGAGTACSTFILEDDAVDFDEVMPPLVRDVLKGGKRRTTALQKLYQMTDRERKQNRVPVVCTSKWDTIDAVAACVTREAETADRRQALLLLNNLSIPMENKAAILLGEPAEALLPALLKLIHERLPDAYLATVCLFNLSYLEDAKSMLLEYVPTGDVAMDPNVQSEYHYTPPLENPNSLLRILEKLLQDYTPYLSHATNSAERQAVRWTVGILRNLATAQENAVVLAQNTVVPSLALLFLEETNNELSLWSRDSLEDSSLLLLVNLVQCPAGCEALDLEQAQRALGKIVGKGGIHDMRAATVLRILEESKSQANATAAGDQDEKKQS